MSAVRTARTAGMPGLAQPFGDGGFVRVARFTHLSQHRQKTGVIRRLGMRRGYAQQGEQQHG